MSARTALPSFPGYTVDPRPDMAAPIWLWGPCPGCRAWQVDVTRAACLEATGLRHLLGQVDDAILEHMVECPGWTARPATPAEADAEMSNP